MKKYTWLALALLTAACVPVLQPTVNGARTSPRIAQRIWPSWRAPITDLLGVRCPSDVSWLVITVVVDTIDGQSSEKSSVSAEWSRTDVSEESLKTADPLLADLDASSAPIGEIFIGWIQATTLHRQPRFVLSTITHAVRPAGRPRELLILSSLAPTRDDLSSLEVPGVDSFDSSAIASASPIDVPAIANYYALQRHESAEALS